ncbi:MAG: hypothetical protein D3909_03800 [Candidatus Electrothrix sp. ATG1]|nr:hypothetical protein [Candidatus Electrothrix sp. ATG1]
MLFCLICSENSRRKAGCVFLREYFFRDTRYSDQPLNKSFVLSLDLMSWAADFFCKRSSVVFSAEK